MVSGQWSLNDLGERLAAIVYIRALVMACLLKLLIEPEIEMANAAIIPAILRARRSSTRVKPFIGNPSASRISRSISNKN